MIKVKEKEAFYANLLPGNQFRLFFKFPGCADAGAYEKDRCVSGV
jgi:hypothetical protein